MKAEVLGLMEGDGVTAEEREDARRTDGGDLCVDGCGIDGVGSVSREAEEDGAIGSVTDAGEGERAVEIDNDMTGAIDEAGCVELPGEAESCAHRADRVGAGGADADLKQFEEAGIHGGSMASAMCGEAMSIVERGGGSVSSGRGLAGPVPVGACERQGGLH